MQNDKLRWWSIYQEPEHELVGRIQLFINYSTSLDENSHLKVTFYVLVFLVNILSFSIIDNQIVDFKALTAM